MLGGAAGVDAERILEVPQAELRASPVVDIRCDNFLDEGFASGGRGDLDHIALLTAVRERGGGAGPASQGA